MNPKYVWAFTAPFLPGDVGVINSIASNDDVEFEIIDPTVTGVDSGWCDGATGHRLVTNTMTVKLIFSDEKYSTMIRLKFGDRARLESMILAENTCSLSEMVL
jgi:hypothetical protein